MDNPRERALIETAIHAQRMETITAEKPQSAVAALQEFFWGVVEKFDAFRHEAAALWDRSPGGVFVEVAEAKQIGGSIWDAVAPAIGEALIDIRKKGVEEAWFGREVTPKEMEVTHHGGIHGRGGDSPASVHQGFHDLCNVNEQMKSPETPDQDKQFPGMDR